MALLDCQPFLEPMNTLGDLCRLQGFDVNILWNGRTIKVDEQKYFQALVEELDPQDTEFLLGQDPREMVRIHMKSAEMDRLGLVSQQIVYLDGTEPLKLVKRVNTPGNPFARFFAQKITSQDK